MKPIYSQTMWVCTHPTNGSLIDTLTFMRRESIKKLIDGTTHSWKYWRTKYGFRCIKVRVELTTDKQSKV